MNVLIIIYLVSCAISLVGIMIAFACAEKEVNDAADGIYIDRAWFRYFTGILFVFVPLINTYFTILCFKDLYALVKLKLRK